MATSADDHIGEEVQIDGNFMHDLDSQIVDDDSELQKDDDCVSEDSFGNDLDSHKVDDDSELQKDDDCVSEDSFGSYSGDTATDTRDRLTSIIADTELDSLPPVYPDEESPKYTPILINQESPPILLQDTLSGISTKPASNAKFSGQMCVVCKSAPAYSRGGASYPTCGFTCASKLSNFNMSTANKFLPEPRTPQYTGIAPSPSSASQNKIRYPMKQRSVKGPDLRQSLRGGASQINMCEVCQVRPRARKAGKILPTCGFTCDAVLTNMRSEKNVPEVDPPAALFQRFQKLSLSDYIPASGTRPTPQQRGHRHIFHDQQSPHGHSQSPRGVTRSQTTTTDRRRFSQLEAHQPCVICQVKPCRDVRFVTCGIECLETLCNRGNSNRKICDYCHRQPKIPGRNQCGKTCRDNAREACLLCRCRPKLGRYPLCGRTCNEMATKWTPLILEARPGHTIYNEVEARFKRAWKGNTECPSIKKVYKIIENKSFLHPYDRYKRRFGNEVFRYHGTSRRCALGSQGNTRICASTACALCSILRTSFQVTLAKSSGAFGAGIYTSSAANKAYSFSNQGSGAMILTKVVLGKVFKVTKWNQVMSCPSGHNSVVFNRLNGSLNETIVYNDDAIRPVFLIIF